MTHSSNIADLAGLAAVPARTVLCLVLCFCLDEFLVLLKAAVVLGSSSAESRMRQVSDWRFRCAGSMPSVVVRLKLLFCAVGSM